MSNSVPSTSKNHSKRSGSSRDRDKNKSVPSESGGSSQCDTPPLTEKDGPGPSQGKFAGIGPDSVQCMADQVGFEISPEVAANLAEDVTYKLRQMISTVALQSEMLKKSRVDSWDINTAFMLSDTSPVVGASVSQYATFGDERLCCPTDPLLNVAEFALSLHSYAFTSLPTVTVEWITDDKSLINNSNISINLQNYYTKVARAILNLRRKLKEVAVQDLSTNTRIGPIFPNLFNLAVLVLNDDNLNALNVKEKQPLKSNVLDMVDALCSNPCSLDTNIQQQFQRLFPVMVSNILGNGKLANKMVAILTKIIRTWPLFLAIGKGILYDYLLQGTKERITAPMVKCVLALGRPALVECLGQHLDYLDECIHRPRVRKEPDIREAMLEASSCLLRSEPTTYLEDFVTTDYTLYEMFGDSIEPSRTIFPYAASPKSEHTSSEKNADDELPYLPLRPVMRRSKLRILHFTPKPYIKIPKDAFFEPTKFKLHNPISIRIKGCRSKDIPVKRSELYSLSASQPMVAASGVLNRFRYRTNKKNKHFPIFGALVL